MKKMIMSTLMLMFATSAFAAKTAYVLEPLSRGGYAEPCPQNPDVPTPANGYCDQGRVCPWPYEPVAKYCFDGGIHRCGVACRDDGSYSGGR